MKAIEFDSSTWASPEDFYSALLPELGAPEWHGRNLDALNDSLAGGINRLEPPFRVEIGGTAHLSSDMAAFLGEVHALFEEARRAFGVEVSLVLK
ncbi:MAG TPA: barstar family protein [Allosphingosinicella sp.]|jgi:RNAse (barnase) inhibitor barstar